MGRKRIGQQPKIESPHFEEPQLLGWPGFRTRAGRSGLDPRDTYAEVGHAESVLLLDPNLGTKSLNQTRQLAR